MCRWLAYSGSPVLIEEFLLKPKHSLIDQSLHSRLGAETTNGDGIGLGWYGTGDEPGVFHSIEPASSHARDPALPWSRPAAAPFYGNRHDRPLQAHEPQPENEGSGSG